MSKTGDCKERQVQCGRRLLSRRSAVWFSIAWQHRGQVLVQSLRHAVEPLSTSSHGREKRTTQRNCPGRLICSRYYKEQTSSLTSVSLQVHTHVPACLYARALPYHSRILFLPVSDIILQVKANLCTYLCSVFQMWTLFLLSWTPQRMESLLVMPGSLP